MYRRSVIVAVALLDASSAASSGSAVSERAVDTGLPPLPVGFFTRERMYLKNSYVDQQMAVAGIWYRTRACIPLKKPIGPAVA
uniref:Putative secreted protein n=1 Tax=Anopheles marajoara TaxID=58244 RepID=A0A2M4CBA8_9DIPT